MTTPPATRRRFPLDPGEYKKNDNDSSSSSNVQNENVVDDDEDDELLLLEDVDMNAPTHGTGGLRVLFLSADTGGGHRASAESLGRQFLLHFPGSTYRVWNVWDDNNNNNNTNHGGGGNNNDSNDNDNEDCDHSDDYQYDVYDDAILGSIAGIGGGGGTGTNNNNSKYLSPYNNPLAMERRRSASCASPTSTPRVPRGGSTRSTRKDQTTKTKKKKSGGRGRDNSTTTNTSSASASSASASANGNGSGSGVWPFNSMIKYYKHLSSHPSQWRLVYHLSNTKPVVDWATCNAGFANKNHVIDRIHRKLVWYYRPDVVISVHPTMNHIPCYATRRYSESIQQYIPFYTVVTDLYSAHSTWFCCDVDQIYVASKRLIHLAQEKLGKTMGDTILDNNRQQFVIQTGLPIRNEFTQQVQYMMMEQQQQKQENATTTTNKKFATTNKSKPMDGSLEENARDVNDDQSLDEDDLVALDGSSSSSSSSSIHQSRCPRITQHGRNWQRNIKIELGLSTDRPVVLVMGGGEGVGSLSTIVEELYRTFRCDGVDATICVVCGRNEKLKDELSCRNWEQRIIMSSASSSTSLSSSPTRRPNSPRSPKRKQQQSKVQQQEGQTTTTTATQKAAMMLMKDLSSRSSCSSNSSSSSDEDWMIHPPLSPTCTKSYLSSSSSSLSMTTSSSSLLDRSFQIMGSMMNGNKVVKNDGSGLYPEDDNNNMKKHNSSWSETTTTTTTASVAAVGEVTLVPLGYLTGAGMAEYMVAADVLVSKAGPGAIAEAASLGLPIMLTSYLPGQEAGNVEYVLERGFGDYRTDPIDIADGVSMWLRDPILLSKLSIRSYRSGTPNAAEQIVRNIGNATKSYMSLNREQQERQQQQQQYQQTTSSSTMW